MGNVVRVRRQEGCIQGFVGRADGRRPLGRPRLPFDDNTKMDVQEVG